MINKLEDIKDLFDIFHDGDIVDCLRTNNTLHLDIKIPYLANKIKENYEFFKVILYGCQNIKFTTWPNTEDMDGKTFTDIKTIFKPNLWILSASITNGKIEISCSQTDSNFDYCGGNLKFNVDSAEVVDESGRQYTINKLADICEEYWNEWDKNNQAKKL